LRAIPRFLKRLSNEPKLFEVGRAVALGKMREMKAIGSAVTDKFMEFW